MKKASAVLAAVLLLLVSLTACGSESVSYAAVVEGSIFGGKNDDRISAAVSFDPSWITKGKNTVYRPELAGFCALLSADSYFRTKDLDKQRQNRVVLGENAEYAMTSFLTAFGFDEAEHYESYLVQTDPTDTSDSVTLNIGHMTADGKDVYAVVIRGCFSWQEWCSAFDPGCANEAYETLTGAHPDWTHKEYFKGIDVAASRALAFIESYRSGHNDENLPDCILLTGHSRGGSIANLLGAYFEKETSVRSFTYTFNAMAAVGQTDAADCKTVFNVFDSSDFFTDPFPFADGGFRRFGKDITLSVADSEAVRAGIAALKGRDDYASVPAEELAEYRRLFAERFPDRGSLCDAHSFTVVYDSAESAAAGREEYLALIGSEAGLGLEDLCSVGDPADNGDGKVGLTVTYCDLSLLRSYAKILAYGSAAYDAVAKLFAGDAAACRIAAWIVENADGINGGHLLANSYVIAVSAE